jgi:2-polyprenyl-6-methoxyphenol hydroxylase-like FAD-dependent oxidoreductase
MARILIAGGSLGGLLAANMLLRDGHDVVMLEKVQGSLDGRGAGIVTHAALAEGLARAGVPAHTALGVSVSSRVALDPRGNVVMRLPMSQVLTSWSRLYALLMQAFDTERCRSGVTVTAVDESSAGVRVRTACGQTFEADLLIASDGLRSSVRERFAPEVVPQYAGYVAWRGVCDEAVLSRNTLTTVFEHFGFALPATEQLIGYPVAGHGDATEPGQRRYNFVWYRPAPEPDGLRVLLTDADGVFHPTGIAPAKVCWRQVSVMRDAARRLLAPQFAEILEKTAQPFLQPIFDVVSQRLVFGRTALMGDAGFVARPHVGMGVTKAAQDAMALSDAVRQHGATPRALQQYEHARLGAGRAVVERARRLGSYLQAHGQGTAAPGMARDAAAVLRETAIEEALWDPEPAPATHAPTTAHTYRRQA